MQQTLKISFSLRRSVLLSVVIVLLLSLAALTSAQEATQEAVPTAPIEALYVTMRDGVEIAVDVYFPAPFDEGMQYPTLMRSTRYWRAIQNLDISEVSPETLPLTSMGYVVVRVDTRGSGASGGQRSTEWSADEVTDYGEIVDWIVAQPWSNGRVGAYGVSYDGNTAELTTVSNNPAVKAVAPQYSDFDPLFQLAMPGGVFNKQFIQDWSDLNVALDKNDICVLAEVEGAECIFTRLGAPGVKNVDADSTREKVNAFVAERNNMNVYEAILNITYRDDGMGLNGESIASISPYGLRDKIESSQTPMYVWASWLDAATIDGTLNRFLTFSNPQKVIVGPWSHGGIYNTDPFLPADAPNDPDSTAQLGMLAEFFDGYLKADTAPVSEHSITYYTLNSGEWQTTSVWPPEGVITQPLYFGADGVLTTEAPTTETGADKYTVDFTASTGESTRWHTQLGGADVVYPDRAHEDKKLLTYTSAPMTADVEITGNPIITLYVASTETDGAFHVYLEDVAPDGTVTYITEGILRAIHRKVSESEPLYVPVGPYHSYTEADAAPLVPGETTEITFGLYATSVLIKEGHSVRVAVAGADASMFERYPAEGIPILTIERSSIMASRLDLPVMVRP